MLFLFLEASSFIDAILCFVDVTRTVCRSREEKDKAVLCKWETGQWIGRTRHQDKWWGSRAHLYIFLQEARRPGHKRLLCLLVTCLKWKASFHRICVFMLDAIIGLFLKLPIFVLHGDASLGILEFCLSLANLIVLLSVTALHSPSCTDFMTASSVVGYDHIYGPKYKSVSGERKTSYNNGQDPQLPKLFSCRMPRPVGTSIAQLRSQSCQACCLWGPLRRQARVCRNSHINL